MKEGIEKLKSALASAECILIGAGAGLSAAAGYDYAGARFLKYFSDFHERFGIEDIYTGGFYPFPTRGLFWAWWSRSIYINRYAPMPESDVYPNLLRLAAGRDYFVSSRERGLIKSVSSIRREISGSFRAAGLRVHRQEGRMTTRNRYARCSGRRDSHLRRTERFSCRRTVHL